MAAEVSDDPRVRVDVTRTKDQGHADGVAARDEVVRALSQLTTVQRRVVVLRHLLDLSEAQTARELGVPLGTVKSANARGIARLREIFEEGAR